MADTVEAMKDWRRMCKFFADESMNNDKCGCAKMCPLGHNNMCGDIVTATDKEIEDAVKAIA